MGAIKLLKNKQAAILVTVPKCGPMVNTVSVLMPHDFVLLLDRALEVVIQL